MEPKVMQVLVCLAQQPGAALSKEKLLQAVWPDTFVTDDVLKRSIFELRRALQDNARRPRIIETISKRGYRLVTKVEWITPSGQPEPAVSKGGELAARSRYQPLVIALLVAVAVMTVVIALTHQSALRVKGLRFAQLTDDTQAKLDSLTTDGSRIYTTELLPGPHAVLVQIPVKGGEAIPLATRLKQPRLFDLSPDGTELLIGNHEELGRFSLWVESVTGATLRRVGELLADDDAEWGPKGQSIVYSNGSDVYITGKEGNSREKLFTAPGRVSDLRFSPDGHLLRFTLHEVGSDSTSLWEASAAGGNVHPLLRDWNSHPSECCGRWAPDGRYYVFQSRRDGGKNIWILPAKSSLWGERNYAPIQLTAGPLDFSRPLPGRDEKSLFAIGTLNRSELVRYDLHTREFVPYLFGVSAESVAFSRDEEWVTYISYPEGTMWRSRVDGSQRLQLTFPPMRVLVPRWSPDGKQIAFMAYLPGKPWNIYVVSFEGGALKQVLAEDNNQADPNWTSDGNSLVFGGLDIDKLPIRILDLKNKHVSIVPGSAEYYSPRCSPDGRYVAAITSQRPYRLMLFDSHSMRWTELGGFEISYPSWSRDGKYVYFLDWHARRSFMESGRISRVRISDRAVESVVELKKLGRLTVGTVGNWMGLAPGDSPLLSRDISTQEVYSVQWQAP